MVDKHSGSPSVSIIVPFKKATPYLHDCISGLLSQKIQNFELICIPDLQENIDVNDERVIVIAKSGTPSEKRNYAVSIARSEIIAFIDDDAIPSENWLETGLQDMEKEGVVGGPNVAPKNEGVRRIASDLFLTSVFGSLREVYRYKSVANKMYVDNLLTVNMLIRKDIFIGIGGFNLNFWPGEDTHFSEELKKTGRRIYYDPNLIVYHHRREVFRDHLTQIWRYAKYRGAAIKIGEFKPFYLISSIFLIFVPVIIYLSIVFSPIIALFAFGLVLFISIGIFANFYKRCSSLLASMLGTLTVWASHVTYGAGVLYGIFFTHLKTESQR